VCIRSRACSSERSGLMPEVSGKLFTLPSLHYLGTYMYISTWPSGAGGCLLSKRGSSARLPTLGNGLRDCRLFAENGKGNGELDCPGRLCVGSCHYKLMSSWLMGQIILNSSSPYLSSATSTPIIYIFVQTIIHSSRYTTEHYE
jgi:hypothetical protein